ncbi:serine/threonine protein kinase [Mycobacteroides immunogenum]|uniref:Serine/threonine protein kinase n=1 Tax=Mycobacteroides immunogenum TaxID=83262 RepID=A0A179VD80_9MYCO|nr:thioredoxin domain-containing protein [Mycobacteroides immunogenum]OAT68963.1 serine/threonine protein kinase [Mycobacteroides immunogenum]
MHVVKRLAMIIGLATAVLVCSSSVAVAHAAESVPVGDVLSIGNPEAPGQIDLYLDPLCPYSGKMVQDQGEEIGRRIESGKLHVNLRFVDFLDKYSASGTYDSRAIYASFVVADQSRSSDITWRFIRQIYAKDQQPQEEGDTDLGNDQLATLAERVNAPQAAQDLIRLGLPVPFDGRIIAANNLPLLRAFPKSGVPMVVIDGQPVDGESNWLSRIPR